MTDYPLWRIGVRHEPGTKGGAWFCDLLRQEKKYAKWEKLSTGQGTTLEIALNAVAHGAKIQALKYPELAS